MKKTEKNLDAGKYELHKYQGLAYQSDARFNLLIAGTQSGKTFFGPIWLFGKHILNHWNDDYLIIAPTYKILEQSTLVKFFAFTDKHINGKWNDSKKIFRLAGGGRIFVRSAEEPPEAMSIRACWADEAGAMKGNVWPAINSRISILKGSVLLTTSPYAQNWVYHEIYKRAYGWIQDREKIGTDKDYFCVQYRSLDNPHFPADEFERMRNTFSDIEFRRRFCGEFLKAEGLVYKVFDRDTHVVKPFEVPRNWPRFMGMDFGYAAPTAIVFCAIDPKGVIYVIGEYYETKTRLAEHAHAIITRGYKEQMVYGDKSAAQEIAEMQAMGIRITQAQDLGVNVGISRLDRLFGKNKIKYFDTCTNLIDETEMYSWENSRDNYGDGVDKVKKKKDHLVDALRYAITSTSYMLPEVRNPEYNREPQLEYDPTTGYPKYNTDDGADSLINKYFK